MKSLHLLRLIWVALMIICSAPSTMAEPAIQEEVRADFFVANSIGGDERKDVLSFNDAAALPVGEIAEESNSGGQQAKEEKRRQQRQSFLQKIFVNSCISDPFFAEQASKGFFMRPLTQDARQERTKTIRFLQLEALAC